MTNLSPNMSRLLSILSIKRGHNSDGELRLIEDHLDQFNPVAMLDAGDDVLAYYVEIGEGSRTLFSSHIDTVHGRSRKKIVPFDQQAANDKEIDPHLNDYTFNPDTNTLHAKGDVLGADDGAGVWLLMEMIDAGVPGHYIFHRGEECGGIGSSGMAKFHGRFLEQFDRAIAFDRKGVHSVITHQGSSRCCSDSFAEALSGVLSCDEYFFSPDDGGVFTDTANYTEHIGECTNVSIGYYNEHHDDERLDLTFLLSMRKKCIDLKWEELPTKRLPGEVDENDYAGWCGRGRATKKLAPPTLDELYAMSPLSIQAFVEDYPEEATDLIWQMMYGNDVESYYSTGFDGLDETEANAGLALGDPRLDVGMR